MSNIVDSDTFADITNEIMDLFSLTQNDTNRIIIESVTQVYESDYPVILEDDGIYALYNDKLKSETIKYVKIKFSAKKSKQIIDLIRDKSIHVNLMRQKELVVKFIKTKKEYLHASYSYTKDNLHYYQLYFDRLHNHEASNSFGVVPAYQGTDKERIYVDYTSATYVQNNVLFRERKNFVTLNNVQQFTKDLSREIFEKIDKKVWIDVVNVSKHKQTVYLHLPYKTTKEIIQHIKNRFRGIFQMDVYFLKSTSKK